MPSPKLLTPEQAADFLSIRVDTLAKWRTTKRYPLPYVKVGASVRYRQADLDRFVEAQVVQA